MKSDKPTMADFVELMLGAGGPVGTAILWAAMIALVAVVLLMLGVIR